MSSVSSSWGKFLGEWFMKEGSSRSKYTMEDGEGKKGGRGRLGEDRVCPGYLRLDTILV